MINLRQGQIEKTMNVNMSAQTVITKFPKNLALFRQTGSISNEFQTCFKTIFNLVKKKIILAYTLVFKLISIKI